MLQCGHLSIRKQSAKRSGQEGATKRQRRVIQLSLGSNEALSFGGCSLGSAMTVVARNPSPDVSIVILKPLQRRFLDLKHVNLFVGRILLTEQENEG